MSDIRCPYCFNKLQNTPAPTNFIWSHDPIFVPIIDETNQLLKQYKGCIHSIITEICELQQNRQTLEEAVLSIEDRTKFTALNFAGIFQITAKHIAELRWSTEKILQAIGLSKEDYFNYDEVGTEYNIGNHKLEWTDALPKTSSQSEWDNYTYDLIHHFLADHFQLKMIHIEDLRHFIQVGWREDWIGLDYSYNESVSGSTYLYKSPLFPSFIGRNSWQDTGCAIQILPSHLGYGTASASIQVYNKSTEESPPSPPLLYKANHYVTGYHCQAYSTIQFTNFSASIPILQSNSILKIEDIAMSYAGNTIYIMAWVQIFIHFKNYTYLRYWARWGNESQKDGFEVLTNGILQRNIYNDYITMYGVVPDITDSNFNLHYIAIDSQIGVYDSGITQTGSLTFQIGKISITPQL